MSPDSRNNAPTILVASYQNNTSAHAVLRSLRRAGFRRSASIHLPTTGSLVVDAGTLGHGALAGFLRLVPGKRLMARLSPLVAPGETLIVVEQSPGRAAAALTALTGSEGEHPLVFTLPSLARTADLSSHIAVPATPEELTMLAARLGHSLHRGVERRESRGERRERATFDSRLSTPASRLSRETPWKGLGACERALQQANDSLSHATGLERSVALSAEWLLDNGYVIQGHIEDVRRNLSRRFFQELPVIASGPHAGQTRPFVLARELIRSADARLDRDNIQVFLQSFQTETTLTMAELWAVPQLLRLALVEHLAERSKSVVRRQEESEIADFWANRLLYCARHSPDRLPIVVAELTRAITQPSPHFAEELTRHLYDEESALAPVRGWLENSLGGPLNEVLTREQRMETAEQVSLANAITSLRLLSQLDWRDLFEVISRVDAILWGDPAGIYARMDFATRDQYRHEVEAISRRTGHSEEEVAQAVVDLCLKFTPSAGLVRHVGYFLLDDSDDGNDRLRRTFGYRPRLREKLVSACRRHPLPAYTGGVAIVASAVLVGCLEWMSARSASLPVLVGLAALLLLPSIEIGVQTVNLLITKLIPPRPLPKMRYENGIPDDSRTLVVIPTLLSDARSIREEVERLEIRFLANPDPNLCFALLTDYVDAPRQHMPEDEALIKTAADGIRDLNARHENRPFLLIHRERMWSESERRWMGWERKRGKIEQLNRMLCEMPPC